VVSQKSKKKSEIVPIFLWVLGCFLNFMSWFSMAENRNPGQSKSEVPMPVFLVQ